jgi:hypothetical protein
LLTPANY